jgi:hypothetical protein
MRLGWESAKPTRFSYLDALGRPGLHKQLNRHAFLKLPPPLPKLITLKPAINHDFGCVKSVIWSQKKQ